MQIRPARYQDIAAISSTYASAFHDESLNVILFPHRNQYPADFLRAWRHRIIEHWWDYKKSFFVSCEIENGKELVVGVAEWSREGDGWERLWGIKGWWDPRPIILPIIKTYHKIHRLLFTNRASVQPTPTDPTPLTYWNWEPEIVPYISKFFIPPTTTTTQPNPHPNPPFVELTSLAVRPSHQSRTHGRVLTTHGLGLARAQNLPTIVIAAENKEQFYQRCGFGMLVGWATEGKGNPLARLGVRGGAILWSVTGEDGLDV